jgi:hypothetical protein
MACPPHPLLLLQRRPSPPAAAAPRAEDRTREAAGARLACHRCLLGWLFRSPDAAFHGLILDRLVEVAMD